MPEPFNSQSLNRYSYVFNNPLRFTDPSGFCPNPDNCGGRGNSTYDSLEEFTGKSRFFQQREIIDSIYLEPDPPQSAIPGAPETTNPAPTTPTGPTMVPPQDPTPPPMPQMAGEVTRNQGEGWMSAVAGSFAATLTLERGIEFGLDFVTVASIKVGIVLTGLLVPNSNPGGKSSDFSDGSYPVFNDKPTVPPSQALNTTSVDTCTPVSRCNGMTAESSKGFFGKLKPFRGKTKTNGELGKKRRFYEKDRTHGDIEVYDGEGRHLGSANPETGEMTKPPVPGRKIDL